MWGKAERTALFSLGKTRLRGDLVTMIQNLKAGYKGFLLQGVPWKRWEVQVTPGEILVYTRGTFFTVRKSAIGIIFLGKWCIPQCQTLQRFSWAEWYGILSRLVFLFLPRKVGLDNHSCPLPTWLSMILLWILFIFANDCDLDPRKQFNPIVPRAVNACSPIRTILSHVAYGEN